jgi:pyruvate-formate lyase-activating enzyme
MPDGSLVDHPTLLAAGRSGDDIAVMPVGSLPMPAGATVSRLPGQRPVGIDPTSGEPVVLREVEIKGRRFRPDAVAAVLPPGYTRTLLPASHRTPLAPLLPQWAYTGVAWDEEAGLVAQALHTDPRSHWDPETHSTQELPALVEARRQESELLRQLATCALEYRCFTAQNIFYGRDEGAIPASAGCNARCVGCISEQLEGEGTASHERMRSPSSAEDMAALGAQHLAHARESAPGRAMISFGQGCEGEPLTRAHHIARAIRLLRAQTSRGSININTNGSRPKAMQLLVDAGLDACRISLNSARRELYEAYYRPVDYGWAEVRETLRIARDGGLYIALNLLTFPGITDRAGEVDALEELIAEFGVHQVQTRNLALDPEQYLAVARQHAHGTPAVGIAAMVRRLRHSRPGVVVGNYARGLKERPGWAPPRHTVQTAPG